MNYRKTILEAGKTLLHSGLTVETWGNLSQRDPETGLVYITPSGMDYETCTEADIVCLHPDGSVASGSRKPSIETGLHLAVYAVRPDVHAIVHTHPIYSTAFSCMGEGIPLFIDEAAQVLGAPVETCPYALPGSEALAKNCAEKLKGEGNACLLKSHGSVFVGKDLRAAFKVARVLEMTAEILTHIRSMGGKPDPLDPKDIAYMRDFALYHYGQQAAPAHPS